MAAEWISQLCWSRIGIMFENRVLRSGITAIAEQQIVNADSQCRVLITNRKRRVVNAEP